MAASRAGLALLLAAAVMAGAPALADDKPPEAPKPGAAGVKAEAPALPRIERAKKLVQELETTLTILRASKTVDAETIKSLERALDEAKKLAQPLTTSEMTEEEKKRIGDELGKSAGGDGKDKGPPGTKEKEPPANEWVQRTLDAAFKDVELTEEEQIAATKIITETSGRLQKAWAEKDSKAQSDIKSERQESLEKAVGKKKAQKIVNNLNGMWGRGGR